MKDPIVAAAEEFYGEQIGTIYEMAFIDLDRAIGMLSALQQTAFTAYFAAQEASTLEAFERTCMAEGNKLEALHAFDRLVRSFR